MRRFRRPPVARSQRSPSPACPLQVAAGIKKPLRPSQDRTTVGITTAGSLVPNRSITPILTALCQRSSSMSFGRNVAPSSSSVSDSTLSLGHLSQIQVETILVAYSQLIG